ncbi:Holliday junction resolvase [Pseudomonas phage PaBG]|uniref:Uncharacterized protein n=1 Tax=Pseudomonas phage PaBG TaxID=1335230 RepID=S5VMC2_9CAUD|nr:Holliday junction resolvase [Pseudomonas phage PaBG]AGS82039.1 putative holliday junction resolvase [Pseudomonas phage PaBG]
MTDLRILAMDPGTSNFAVSIMRLRWANNRFQFKCEGTTMLDPQRLLKDMKTMRSSLNTFRDYVQPLFEVENLDAFVAERFQARGGKGPTIESVNCMLGCMAQQSNHIKNADFITAGVWKNEFNRYADLKEMYLDLADLRKEKLTKIAIHQLDSMLLGIYVGCKLLGVRPFSFIDTREKEAKLLKALSSAPPINFLPAHLPKQKKTKKRRRKS